MSPRLRILFVISLIVLFAGGLFIGKRVGSPPAIPAPVAPKVSQAAPASPDLAELEAAERRGRQLRGQVETLELALHAARGTQPPEPEPVAAEMTAAGAFPEDLPEQFTPAGFEQIVRDVVRECALGVDLAEIDCSEYPCLAWVRSKELTRTYVTPSECGRWKESFSSGSVVTYHLEGNPFGGRTERYHVWAVMPPNRDRDANQQHINWGEKRMNARWNAMIGEPVP
jgi:hypothetical protein